MCGLRDSHGFGAPGRDVRALLEKAKIGDSRYVTFAAPKPPDGEQRQGETVKEAVQTAASFPSVGHLPSAQGGELTSRLRVASEMPRPVARKGASLAFASVNGGAGKTTLCATVARAFSMRLNNIVVADRCQDGITPFYFGMERKAAGGLQTVYPSGRRAGYPIVLIAAPWDEQISASTDAWVQQMQKDSNLSLMDLPTGALPPAILEGVDCVIVPVSPDIQSVASIGRVRAQAAMLTGTKVSFLLNRYQESRQLHREIRGHLEKELADQLSPVVISESEYVAEALSLGKTVLDHVPLAPVAREVEQLATWLESALCEPEAASGKAGIA